MDRNIQGGEPISVNILKNRHDEIMFFYPHFTMVAKEGLEPTRTGGR